MRKQGFGHRDTEETLEASHVKMEAEMVVTCLHAKEHQGLLATTRSYGCESWTMKKAERRRIDASELWCWRRILRVPWTARRSNQSILKVFIGRTDVEAETPILGHLMRRAESFEKTLMLGKIEGRRRRGREDDMVGWHHRLNGHEFE